MEKIKIDSVKVVSGKAGKGDLYVITSGSGEYLCFQREIQGKLGQEVEGEIGTLRSGKASFKIAGVASTAPGKLALAGGGRPFGRSPDDLALTAKTMSASYAKDLAVACYAADLSFDRLLEMFEKFYDVVYGKIMGLHPQRPDPDAETRQESAKPARESEASTREAPKTEDPRNHVPPPVSSRNEVTCGGANAKLKGKAVSEKFCKVCSFRGKCEVRNAPAPLPSSEAPKGQTVCSLGTSGKSSAPESSSPAPSAQDKVPVSFIMKTVTEQKRVGKEVFHDILTAFDFKTASAIKDPDMQASFLEALAAEKDA